LAITYGNRLASRREGLKKEKNAKKGRRMPTGRISEKECEGRKQDKKGRGGPRDRIV